MENSTGYSTRDLGMAATLLTLHFKMIGTFFQYEGNRSYPIGYFEFEKTPQLETTITEYIQGKLAVEPRALLASVRELKAITSNFSRNPSTQEKQAPKA